MANHKKTWLNPISLRLVPTRDSTSFLTMPEDATGLPLLPHPGAFGVKRKHHRHEGVDLYVAEGGGVFAVEDGIVVCVKPFTGPSADLPWWNDTQAVFVEGASGVVVYGEIEPLVGVGSSVKAGDLIGSVVTVLKTDKGRPMAMLHLELHTAGSREAPAWGVDEEKPAELLDPTPFLVGVVE